MALCHAMPRATTGAVLSNPAPAIFKEASVLGDHDGGRLAQRHAHGTARGRPLVRDCSRCACACAHLPLSHGTHLWQCVMVPICHYNFAICAPLLRPRACAIWCHRNCSPVLKTIAWRVRMPWQRSWRCTLRGRLLAVSVASARLHQFNTSNAVALVAAPSSM